MRQHRLFRSKIALRQKHFSQNHQLGMPQLGVSLWPTRDKLHQLFQQRLQAGSSLCVLHRRKLSAWCRTMHRSQFRARNWTIPSLVDEN